MEIYTKELELKMGQIKGFKGQFYALKTHGKTPRLLSISVREGEFLALFTSEDKIGAGEREYEVVQISIEEIIKYLKMSSDLEGVIINYGNDRIIIKNADLLG